MLLSNKHYTHNVYFYNKYQGLTISQVSGLLIYFPFYNKKSNLTSIHEFIIASTTICHQPIPCLNLGHQPHSIGQEDVIIRSYHESAGQEIK